MVGLGHDQRPLLPRHRQDPAREQQAGGPRRRDEGHGREDDVRSAAEGDGEADER